jgi:hypothetical protein
MLTAIRAVKAARLITSQTVWPTTFEKWDAGQTTALLPADR